MNCGSTGCGGVGNVFLALVISFAIDDAIHQEQIDIDFAAGPA